jgi:cytochrome c556
MKKATQILITTFVLSTGFASGIGFAKEGVADPTVKAWMDLMGSNGANSKILGDMAGGKTAFDASAAEAAKAALIANAAETEVKFATQASDPVSDSKPEIWTDWAGFVVKAQAQGAAATALDVSSVESIQAGMGAIGATCGACHKEYRIKR